MFTLISGKTTGSLLFKLGIRNDINDLSDESGLFSDDAMRPLITSSAYYASKSLSEIAFDFDAAAVSSSATTGSLTGSELTFIQYVATEVQEHNFNRLFYSAYGIPVGHLGIEQGSFDETIKAVDFEEGMADKKVMSVRNLISQSRGEDPISIPGYFHVNGSENIVFNRRTRHSHRIF